MGIELKLYERAVMSVKEDLKPGQVLEALPGADATLGSLYAPSPAHRLIAESPTNVFGYVRGFIQRHAIYNPALGTGIVEMLFHPFAERCTYQWHGLLQYWTAGASNVFLVVGEIARTKGRIDARSSGIKVSCGYVELLSGDSVMLNQQEFDALHWQAAAVFAERKRNDYFFVAPKGRAYSLQEILLSLVEKPKKKPFPR